MQDKAADSTAMRSLGLGRWGIVWVIFVLMIFTFPSLYFLVQVFLFLPLVAIFLSIFQTQEPGIRVFSVIHVLIITPVYFVIAYLIARRIGAIESTFIRGVILLSIVTFLAALPFLPVYVGGGHGNAEYYSWMESFRLLLGKW
jgi:hypothetical protein